MHATRQAEVMIKPRFKKNPFRHRKYRWVGFDVQSKKVTKGDAVSNGRGHPLRRCRIGGEPPEFGASASRSQLL
jgi:hypothetical protein